MKYLSVCSGIEAASVAWHPLGWTPIGFSEVEPFPSAVLAHHYPDIPNFGDMTKHEQWNIQPGTVDLLVGGTPCQSFSVAGLRQGLRDPRGNLMLTFLAIAARLRPRWVVWENVPGVLSSNGGKDFGCFLGGLGELGYGWAYRVLDAQWVRTHGHPRAVPQRRRRVFVVGCLGDQRSAAKVLFEQESLQRYSATRRATRKGTAADVAGCLRSGGDGGVPSSRGEHLVFDQQRQGQYGDGCVASTKNARDFKDATDIIVIDRAAFNQGANANYPPHIEETDVMDPLVARGPHAVAVLQPVPFVKAKRAQSTTDNETWVEGLVAPTQNAFDVAPSIVSRYGTGGGNVPLVIPIQDSRVIEKNQNGIGVGNETSPAYTIDQTGAQAVAIQGTVIGRQDHNGPQGSGCSVGGEMFTLNSTDVHAVAVGCFKWGQSAKARSLGFSETESPTLGASSGNGIPAVAIVGQVDWRTTNNDSGQVSQTLKTDLAHQSGPCLAVAVAIPIMPQAMQAEGWRVGKENQDGRGNGLGVGKDGDPCPTLDRSAVPAVAHAFYSTGGSHGLESHPEISPPLKVGSSIGIPSPVAVAVAPTITATNDPSRSPQSSEITQQVAAVHASTMQVRRLTPTECERLQGFPDGWTAIPWKKKDAEDCPDGPRYKALGNSMAVNCMEWIGERINAVSTAT